MKIFISYRRSDVPGRVGRLFDHLENRFGAGNVYLDVDSDMTLGLDFRDQITSRISKVDIVLVVIGDRWMRLLNEKSGHDRDYVEMEIESAMKLSKPVIPILFEAKMPSESDLPPSIGQLAYMNGMVIDIGSDFRHQIGDLFEKLEQTVVDTGTEVAHQPEDLPAQPTAFDGGLDGWISGNQLSSSNRHPAQSLKKSAPKLNSQFLSWLIITALLVFCSYSLFQNRNKLSATTHVSDTKSPTPNIATIAIIQFAENPLLEEAISGFSKQLSIEGYHSGSDYQTIRYNANQSKKRLTTLVEELDQTKPDYILTVTTPAMIAVSNKISDIPIVFTVASHPQLVGVYKHGTRPANLVGVHDDPPVEDLIKLAISHNRALRKVGTIWNPTEPNSKLSFQKLRRHCAALKLDLIEAQASSAGELTLTTTYLCEKGIEVLILSADNLTTTGLNRILEATQSFDVPIYSTEPSMVERGIAAAIGDDYEAWGKQSGELMAKLLGGSIPAELDIQSTRIQQTKISEKYRKKLDAK